MNVLILHGTMGSPEGNWFPWIVQKCKDSNIEVSCPQLPTPEDQSLDNWLKAIENENINEGTIVIGHSCGASLLVHLLQKYKMQKAIFVSTVMDSIGIEEYDELNKSFFDFGDINWQTIKNNAQEITIYHGGNDPYVPLIHAEKLHNNINGSKLNIIKYGGHLNAETGYTEFPEIWNEIIRKK